MAWSTLSASLVCRCFYERDLDYHCGYLFTKLLKEPFQGTKYTSQVKSPTKMKMYILTQTHGIVLSSIIYLTVLCSSQANSSQFKLKWWWFTKYASFNHSQNISQKYFRMDYNSKNNSHKLHICIFFFFNQRNQYRNPDVS